MRENNEAYRKKPSHEDLREIQNKACGNEQN